MAEYKPKTSQDAVAPHLDPLAGEAEKMAEDAGVKDAAFVDYEDAMDNYQQRADVETLASRRAREGGWKFEDTAFRRKVDADDELTGGPVTTDQAANQAPEQKSAPRKSSK